MTSTLLSHMQSGNHAGLRCQLAVSETTIISASRLMTFSMHFQSAHIEIARIFRESASCHNRDRANASRLHSKYGLRSAVTILEPGRSGQWRS